MATLQRGHSAIAQKPEVSGIRELSRADLMHLQVKRPPNQVQALRDSHHRVARAVASGLKNIEVSASCGISITRIGQLKADPSFQELVAHYRGVLTAEWAQADTVVEYMRSNALKAQAMLSDKLDAASESNEFLPTRDLVSIAELGLDRTGYGKVNKNINVNVDFASKLEAARRRSDRARDITPSPTLAPLIDASASPSRQSAVAKSASANQPRPSILRRV